MRKLSRFKKIPGLVLAGILVMQASPGLAQQSSASAYAGALSVDSGFDDRYFTGGYIDHYLDSGLGVHAEASGVAREEDAGFFAGGLSYALNDRLRPQIMAGTSTDNDDILPELYLRGSLEIHSDPEQGIVATPSITYRDYRNGTDEVVPGLSAAIYLPPFADGSYVVAQALGMVMFVDPGSNTGYEIGGGASLNKPGLGSFGLVVTGGEMAYDSVLATNAPSINNDFVTFRPNIGLFLSGDVELFVRGEYTHTDFYDIVGGLAGLKINY